MALAIIRNIGGGVPDVKWTDWDITGLAGASKHVGDPEIYGWDYVFTATQASPKIQDNCYLTLSWSYINENTGAIKISTDDGATWATLASKAVSSSDSFNINLNSYKGQRCLFQFTCHITSGSWGYNITIPTAQIKK